jgi:hypothetical protein
MSIWYILSWFDIFFTVLVYYAKKIWQPCPKHVTDVPLTPDKGVIATRAHPSKRPVIKLKLEFPVSLTIHFPVQIKVASNGFQPMVSTSRWSFSNTFNFMPGGEAEHHRPTDGDIPRNAMLTLKIKVEVK